MGRKPKYSKEEKIQACCKDYEKGNGSFGRIANEIGANEETVRGWYLRYKEHGPSALETSHKNCSYSKNFKALVIEEYTSGKYSLSDIAIKYNIANGVILNWVKNGIMV